MIVSFSHVIALAGLLLVLGMACVAARRNLVMVLLGLEIMLNAASIAFVGASLRWQNMEGHAMVIIIMAIAAAEVSVGLALIVALFRRTGSVDPGMEETNG